MILFELLKVIGYVLLILLLLLLVIIFLILFIPVLYSFNLNSDNGFVLTGKLKVLLGIITAEVITDNDEKIKIKVFGIPLKFVNFTEDEDFSTDDNLKEEEQLFNMSVQLNNTESEKVKRNSTLPGDDSLINRIKNLITKIKEFIKSLINSVKNIINKVESFIEFITDENVITAFTNHKGRIFKILTHLGPKKSDLVLKFGFEDPSTVGYILALISPFYSLYGNWLKLEPYFDEKIFNIKGNVKGRAYIYYLLWHFIRVYFNKNVKTIRNKYKTSM